MGKNELGKVVYMADRPYLFFLSFGQSHFKHTKDILIELNSLQRTRIKSAHKTIRNEKTADKWNLVLPKCRLTEAVFQLFVHCASAYPA